MKQEGYKQIRDCASNEGMFFRASNENIKSVFNPSCINCAKVKVNAMKYLSKSGKLYEYLILLRRTSVLALQLNLL